MRLTAATLLATIASLTATSLLAGPAQAASLACGDTITGDVVLRHDLTCSGTALFVELPEGATARLDLHGHRIRGDGTGSGIDTQISGGTGARRTIEVSNGTITGFDYALGESNPNRPRADLLVRRVTLRANAHWLGGSVLGSNATLENSRVIDSGPGGVAWVGTLTARHSTFVRSEIYNYSGTFARLYGNTFVGSGFGHGMVSNVTAIGNTFRGCDTGIAAADVWPNVPSVIEHNLFDGCTTGVMLYGSAGSVTVRGNTFVRNREAGLSFSVGSDLALDISGNRAVRNGRDGITGTGDTATVVRGNRAVRNGGHGINVSGVTDGGGNRAAQNATPPQCIGVVCTR